MSGYIAMARRWQDHDLFEGDEFSRRDAWAWLIANAAWKDGRARVKGAIVDLKRGELCFSQRFLAQKWGWSKSRVDRFLALLRDEGMIETRSKIGAVANHKAGHGQSLISICNYNKYQISLNGQRGNVEPQNGATAGQQRGKEEEGKEGKKSLSSPKGAETFIPDDWEPAKFGEGSKSRAIVDGWPADYLETQVEKFTAYHVGHRSKWADWQKAWSTWVLNAGPYSRRSPQAQHYEPGSIEANAAYCRKVADEQRQEREWRERQKAKSGATFDEQAAAGSAAR